MTPEEIEQQARGYLRDRNIIPEDGEDLEIGFTDGSSERLTQLLTEFALHYHNQEMKEKIEGLILKWEKMRKYSLGESKLSGGNFGNDIEETKAELLEWCIDDLKALLP